jgi:hypothetical protein
VSYTSRPVTSLQYDSLDSSSSLFSFSLTPSSVLRRILPPFMLASSYYTADSSIESFALFVLSCCISSLLLDCRALWVVEILSLLSSSIYVYTLDSANKRSFLTDYRSLIACAKSCSF